MNINDILGFGKVLPIDKLFDIVSNSVGKLSKPYFDRKDVDTKAYEIERLAEARAKEMKIIATAVKENFQLTGGIGYEEGKLAISSPKELPFENQQTILINPPLEDRTQERINFQDAKKQLNIENITAFAAEELKNEPPITDEPLGDDWTTRFFRIAEDISDQLMQALWGKILAGEIKQPKSYSLRTLELVRNLSKNEANVFIKTAKFTIQAGGKNFLFKGKDDETLKEKFNVTYSDRALLTEIGLLQPGTFVNYQLVHQTSDSQHILISGNILLFIKIKANTPTVQMPVDVFSNAGNELLKLIRPNPSMDYLALIANSIKNENIEVKYAHILAFEEDSVRYTEPLLDFQ